VKELNLFEDDRNLIESFDYVTHQNNYFQVMGLPAPALLPFKLKRNTEEKLNLKALETL
jgi:hypothetical protein